MDELFETGAAVRREVLGPDYADKPPTELGSAFREYVTRTAWGQVWARDGLDRRTRSAITLAVLTALRCEDELGMHITAARRNGLTDQEIAEVLLHTAVYAGAPAGNSAMRVLDSMGS
jgi:4-carboxymuconolactone decarboxylase